MLPKLSDCKNEHRTHIQRGACSFPGSNQDVRQTVRNVTLPFLGAFQVLEKYLEKFI